MNRLFVAGAMVMTLVGASAMAADMPVKAPVPAVAAFSWTGCYVGGNGGFGWNNGLSSYKDVNSQSDPINGIPTINPVAFVPVPANTNGSGGLGGAGAGCNWQSQRFVYGIEGDFDWIHFSGSQSTAVPASFTAIAIAPGIGAPVLLRPASATASEQVSLRWLSTVRGRVGFAAQEHLLLFVTGGLAAGEVNSQGSLNVYTPPVLVAVWGGSASTTRTGYAVGAGGEWAFAAHWTAKGEFLWYDLGSASHPLNCTFRVNGGCSSVYPTLGSTDAALHGSIVRAGINYKFN